jgi:hypothetical protein
VSRLDVGSVPVAGNRDQTCFVAFSHVGVDQYGAVPWIVRERAGVLEEVDFCLCVVHLG